MVTYVLIFDLWMNSKNDSLQMLFPLFAVLFSPWWFKTEICIIYIIWVVIAMLQLSLELNGGLVKLS